MPGKIVAYEWLLNGTTHVVYQTNDNHIREVIGDQHGRWRDADITRAAGGPALEDVVMAGYDWPAGRTQQIAYVSPINNDGHIHELVQLQDHPWSYEDVMKQPIGTPAADGFALVGYGWKAGGTKHIVYTGLDGHIHQLSAGLTGMWQHTDLTSATTSPPVEGIALSAFAWETGKSQHVIYISGDGHIHELMMVLGSSWTHTDLIDRTEAPLADGSALVGYGWEKGGTKQVVYTGNNGNIYELVARTDNVWTYADLTSLTSAPLAEGTALASCAWETGGTKQVVYVAENHRIQELQADGSGTWTHTDLIQLTEAPVANNTIIVAHEWSSQFAKHVVYLDMHENPHLHSLLLKHGSRWEYADLTDLTGAQTLA
jgi:hypothetical protein